MSKIITAIDVGSHKVSTVIAVSDEDNKAKVIGESSYPSFGIKKGEVTGIDGAIDSISNSLLGAERMAGVRVTSAFVSINGRNIVSNNYKGVVAIAGLESEIIESDVIRSLEQARTVAIPQSREIIHLLLRQFIVDQQTGINNPVGMTGSRLELDAHIVSAPVTSIHNLERCVQSVGLRIDSTVFTGWASALSVLTKTEKDLGVILLDIGGGTTSITCFIEDSITYSASFPLGGTSITKDLAGLLRMQMDEAEKIKIDANELIKKSVKSKDEKKDTDILDISSYNIENLKTISKKYFLEIIEARVLEIIDLALNNIKSAGFETSLPAGIVITGGSAGLPGITKMVQDKFGIPARIGTPKGLSGLVDSISSPDYSTVLGMILYGLEEENSIYPTGTPRFNEISTKKGSSLSAGGMLSPIKKFFKNFMP